MNSSSIAATNRSSALSNELRDIDPAIASLRTRISGLGAGLFDIEQSPALPLASGSTYAGLTEKTVGAVQSALRELWVGYPRLVAAMETIETVRGTSDSLRSGERDTLRSLLAEGHAELAGKTMEGEHDRLAALLSTAHKNLDVIDLGFSVCATKLGELETLARSAMTSAERTGERINEVSRLAKQLAEQRVIASSDPLGWNGSAAAGIDMQLHTLASELGVVLQTQDQLDDLVASGAKRLDALRLLIANGIVAAAKTKSRMADTDSLPSPLRVSVLDGADGLRTRLGALSMELSVDPRKARQLWILWDRDMNRTESAAHLVLSANAKPIAERDALRGRLDGFEAKAAAVGVVEMSALVQLHRDAMTLLTTPPVSLSACEVAVSAYGQAVGTATAGRLAATDSGSTSGSGHSSRNSKHAKVGK
jgi:hypothetical protein